MKKPLLWFCMTNRQFPSNWKCSLPEKNLRGISCLCTLRGVKVTPLMLPVSNSKDSTILTGLVSVRVKLCSSTFLDEWETLLSMPYDEDNTFKYWQLYQRDLNCNIMAIPVVVFFFSPTARCTTNLPMFIILLVAHVFTSLSPVVTVTPRSDGGMNLASAAL